jgi:UDP-glucose:(heptosyl)LPS alpha-1,3-glucosyltransferase
MRVGLVYRHFNLSGSLPRFHVELARGLSQRGHEVHVFAIGETCDESLAVGCMFHHVSVGSIGDGRGYSARELWSFARSCGRLLRRVRPGLDVVHVRTPSVFGGGHLVHVSQVARADAARSGVSSIRWAASQARHPANLVRARLERLPIRDGQACRFHTDAPQTARDLGDRYGIDPSRVRFVAPGVELSLFQPARSREAVRTQLGLPREGAIVCFCGHDFARKGLDRAISALARMTQAARLIVVGNGDQGQFHARAAELGVADRVVFAGARTDTHRCLQAADVFVLPTREDVWGTTTVEAMACATVPIVTAVAGSAEAVDHSRTGFVLSEPFDHAELAARLDGVLADASLRHTMGAAAAKAAAAYSWDAHVDTVEADLAALATVRKQATSRDLASRL